MIADRGVPKSIIGIAYPYTHIGGHQLRSDQGADEAPPEVVWRLVLDRVWSNGKVEARPTKETLENRYVLRAGEFIELSEEAT